MPTGIQIPKISPKLSVRAVYGVADKLVDDD